MLGPADDLAHVELDTKTARHGRLLLDSPDHLSLRLSAPSTAADRTTCLPACLAACKWVALAI